MIEFNKLYWRWSFDGTVCYVEYLYLTKIFKRVKVKKIASYHSSNWEAPSGAREAAENLIERIKK